eukprot:CAMPEP_0174237896 /NCGR_PEP_ID=MMETSP0417-20130205/9653_1 /TAXON_ID=242541 /ORGANISM="Mayorella sp, Strain BSH-02190019" /LENGTH=639 /DNA_ID=CAMNT_0015316689 /DNA_START=37 /DNA_END=1952 /DNA_ORIENTATION=+
MADDDASSALIAQLLAEDYMSQAAYSGLEHHGETGTSSEEENLYFADDGAWSGSRATTHSKRRKSRAATKDRRRTKGAKRIQSESASSFSKEKTSHVPSEASTCAPCSAAATTTPATDDNGADKKKKRLPPRAWDENEEAIFMRGLNEHGRDWQRIAEMLGTRSRQQVSSHAQKFFIRLYFSNSPLPAKVQESGHGYTLSGKTLDPTSPSAELYGKSMSNNAPPLLAMAENALGLEGIPQTQSKRGKQSTTKRKRETSSGDTGSVSEANDSSAVPNSSPIDTPMITTSTAPVRLPSRTSRAPKPNMSASPRKPARRKAAAPATQPTRSNPRRAASQKFLDSQANAQGAGLGFVRCRPYDDDAIPFEVEVCPTTLVLADFHAHLSHQEVIGYLGGRWDESTGRVLVKGAFPGVSIIPTDGTMECEMCPISEIKLREQIAKLGLSVVGWYHSHPAFPVVPSLCDVQNQANLQLLFREGTSVVDPFVGLIVGPYCHSLSTPHSAVEWFHVEAAATTRKGRLMRVSPAAQPPDMQEIKAQLDRVLELCAGLPSVHLVEPSGVHMEEVWKELGGMCTYRQRMLSSLSERLRACFPADADARADASSDRSVAAPADREQRKAVESDAEAVSAERSIEEPDGNPIA